MDKRAVFDSINGRILDFVANCGGCVRQAHIERIFQYSLKNIRYLVKHKRLFQVNGGLLADEIDINPKMSMITALNVLCDLYDKVSDYSIAEYPTQISFVSHSGDFYEIVYVRQGDEVGIQASFNLQAQKQSKLKVSERSPIPKRIAILESFNQAEIVNIPGVVRFATTQNDSNKMTYFNKKVEG
ncbi:MAG: DUF5697 family protein [Defluviitaleaceae bacterium]|nr:DUF5697 family protein [Defluviitaleaceae bacterium]